MANLSTKYMGLELRNPVIVASSNLTSTVEKITQCAEAGAGAIVVKSLFEEQITADIEADMAGSDLSVHAEAEEYLSHMGKHMHLDGYLKTIKEAKNSIEAPIIASLNCVTSGAWTDWASGLEDTGADALELNVFIMPADVRRKGQDFEDTYLEIARKIKKRLSIPVAMKLGPHFSAPSAMIKALAGEGIDGFVLFNRFYRPDVDVETLTLKPGSALSSPVEMGLSLQWIALLSGEIDADFSAATGIHDGEAAIKQLLVGAQTVQLCSTLLKNGRDRIGEILEDIRAWMDRKGYDTIAEFNGMLCQEHSEDPESYERSQYIKALTGVS